MVSRRSIVLAVVLLGGCVAQDPLTFPGPVIFAATGCGPYTPDAEQALESYVDRESEAARVNFLIHLGDVISGKFGRIAATLPDRGEGQYAKVSGWLGRMKGTPVLTVPGDNEWVDRTDPEVGWGLWKRYFLKREWEEEFGRIVVRQEARVENFSFVLKGVLFIGVNNVTGPAKWPVEQWATCLRDGAEWVGENLSQPREGVRAAVIFAQSKPSPNLREILREEAPRFARPILYLQADEHRWKVSDGTLAPNVLHVVTDSISLKYPAVHVTVTEDPTRPFEFDRELK